MSTPYRSISGSRSASIVCCIAPTVSSPGPATSIASPNSAPAQARADTLLAARFAQIEQYSG